MKFQASQNQTPCGLWKNKMVTIDNTEDDHSGDTEAFGILPNSQLEAAGGAFGASYIGERSFIGFSLSNYDAKYGLPGHSHSHHDDHGDEHDDDHNDPLSMTTIDAHGDEEGGAVLILHRPVLI